MSLKYNLIPVDVQGLHTAHAICILPIEVQLFVTGECNNSYRGTSVYYVVTFGELPGKTVKYIYLQLFVVPISNILSLEPNKFIHLYHHYQYLSLTLISRQDIVS